MRWTSLALALLLATVALTGCIGSEDLDAASQDDVPVPSEETRPTYELPSVIQGVEQVAGIEHGSAGGLVIEDGLAYASGLGSGFFIVDIQDPRAPEKLAQLEELYARDADLLTADDGRPIVALAAGGAGLHLVDVSDPTNPVVTAAEVDVGAPVHNLVTVPGTSLIYNSRSLGDVTAPGIDIIDASDPANPEVAEVWTFPAQAGPKPIATTGCHDITVFPDADRAYCAGVTQTHILDMSDPMDLEVLGTVENPLINIHHWATPTGDHELLIIGDEYGGAAAPACFGAATAEDRTASTPTGALWFYDISDPSMPVLQGWVSAPTQTENPTGCTSHFGALVPGHDLVATGWYNAGVLLVDFSDPTSPFIKDQYADGTNVWDVGYDNGHLFTGDIGKGMDVLRLTGE